MNPVCPETDDLRSYVTGTLAEDRVSDVERHLSLCAKCAQKPDDFEKQPDDFLSLLQESAGIPPAKVLNESPFLSAVDLICRREFAEAASHSVANDSTQTVIGNSRADVQKSTPESPDPTPQSLGQYDLLEEIGRGGMGVVYKARHRKLNRIVALKVLSDSLTADESTLERFENEMLAIGSLDHPNIVRALDADEVDGVHLLVMDYADGENLSSLIRRRGRVPVNEACDWIQQAALGLQHIHDGDMVHRDIKPGNLMLSQDGSIRILDLGLALLTETHGKLAGESLTATGLVMGTLDYMAPEQADNTHTVDIRADIYSLGATFYALLTGQAPYAKRGDGSVLQKLKILALEHPTPIREIRDDVPQPVLGVVERMMAKEPANRFAVPRDVIAAMSALPKLGIMASAPVISNKKLRTAWHWTRIAIVIAALGFLIASFLSPARIAPKVGSPVRNPDTEEVHSPGGSAKTGPVVLRSQRDAAEFIIAQGAKIAVTSGNGPDPDWVSNIVSPSDLPPDPLHVLQISFPAGTEISGADLRSAVSSLPELKNCILAFHQRLAPEHVAALEGTSTLGILILGTIEPSTVDDKMLARVLKTNENIHKLAVHGIGLNGNCLDALPAPDNLIQLQIGSPRTDFSENQIAKLDVSWMENLKRFPYLEILELPRVELSQEHLLPLKDLTALRTLIVHGCPNMEKHLAAFSVLRQIRELNVGNGTIRNSHLTSLYECSHLELLEIGTASVSALAVEELRKHLPYTQIQTDAKVFERLHSRAEPQVKVANAIHALKFDGVDDFVQLPIRYDGSHPITIEAWATPLLPQTDDYSKTIVGNKNSGGLSIDFRTKAWFGFYNDGSKDENGSDGLGYNVLRQPNGWPDFKQHGHTHIALAFDGTSIRLFVNGELQQSALVVGPHRKSKYPLLIGADAQDDASPPVDSFFRGFISEVRVSRVPRYKDNFSPNESLSVDDDTIAIYNFEGNDHLVLKDHSGNEHHGSIHGAEWTTIDFPQRTAD